MLLQRLFVNVAKNDLNLVLQCVSEKKNFKKRLLKFCYTPKMKHQWRAKKENLKKADFSTTRRTLYQRLVRTVQGKNLQQSLDLKKFVNGYKTFRILEKLILKYSTCIDSTKQNMFNVHLLFWQRTNRRYLNASWNLNQTDLKIAFKPFWNWYRSYAELGN